MFNKRKLAAYINPKIEQTSNDLKNNTLMLLKHAVIYFKHRIKAEKL
jgi:hypothetical protein